MSVLSSEAFDAALRRRLAHFQGAARHRADLGVLCCAWQPGLASARGPGRSLAGWLARGLLQDWVRQVPGSVVGQTASGTLLLMVPAFSQAQDTQHALHQVLDRASRALGMDAAQGAWALRVIGPLTPGPPEEVARQLALAGWPVS